MASVLVVEDDEAIAEPLCRALRREGYEVGLCRSGPEGLRAALSEDVDLVLLDLGLPGMDGLEVCRRLRVARPSVQILVLTARAEEIDAVIGLDAGADDYVAKPFRVAELLARVRAMARRTVVERVSSNGVRIDAGARRAYLTVASPDGAARTEELLLSPKEFDLLAALVRNAGRVVSRQTLMREVWGTSWMGSSKTIDQHVSLLRNKLGDDAVSPRYLTTVRGTGFRFETGSEEG